MFSESDWRAKWMGASWQDDSDPEADNSAHIQKGIHCQRGTCPCEGICLRTWLVRDVPQWREGRRRLFRSWPDGLHGQTGASPIRGSCWSRKSPPTEPRIAYDITDMLGKGANAVSMLLGSGYFHEGLFNNNTIKELRLPRFILQMALEYSDGAIEYVCSDTTWKEAHSPVVFSNLYQGEVYDANFEIRGWNKPGIG